MARPRKVSDEQIFEAAYRLMAQLGPAQWTLADVAAEVGITAGALVQRFGSKRALQVALIAGFADDMPAMYEALRQRHDSPLAALRAYADDTACLAASPDQLAHHLDYLRLDLTDPDMRVHFARSGEAALDFVRGTVTDAVRMGELSGVGDIDRFARLIEATVTGSLFTWATHQEGGSRDWLRRDLETLLAPFVRRPRRS